MCFSVSSIKLLLFKKIEWYQKQRLAAKYKLVGKYPGSYANDTICMKKFYWAFKQIKVQDKYFWKIFYCVIYLKYL